MIDKLIRHDINLLRVIRGHENEVEAELLELQRELVALTANDYKPTGPTGRMIQKADTLIDKRFKRIAAIIQKQNEDTAEYDLEKMDEIYG